MSLPTAPCRTAHAPPRSPLLRGPRPLSYLFMVFPSTKPVLPEWVLRSRSGGRPLMWTERVIRHRGPWGLPHPPSLPSPRREPFPRLCSHGSHSPHKREASGEAALDVPLASLEGKGQPRANPHSPTPIACSPHHLPSLQGPLCSQGWHSKEGGLTLERPRLPARGPRPNKAGRQRRAPPPRPAAPPRAHSSAL